MQSVQPYRSAVSQMVGPASADARALITPSAVQFSLAALCALAALALNFSPESMELFSGAAAVSSLVCIIEFALLLTSPTQIAIWDIFAAIVSLAYGLGTLVALFNSHFDRFTLLADTHAWLSVLSTTMSGILLLTALLLLCGQIDPCRLSPRSPIPRQQHLLIAIMAMAMLAISAVLVITGRMGFQADIQISNGLGSETSGIGLLVVTWTPPVGALALYCARSAEGRLRLLLWLCSACILVVTVTQGRRAFAYEIICYVFAFVAGGAIKQVPLRRFLLLSVAIAPVVVAQFYFFYTMRLVNWEANEPLKLQELVTRTISKVATENPVEVSDDLKENVAERSFMIDYLAELFAATRNHPPIGGRLLVNGIASAVPSALWPEKPAYVYGADENLVHPELGMPIWDGPNTLLSAGISDFGVPGLFLYPIAALLLFSWILRVARRGEPLIYCALFFSILNILLNIEAGLAGYTANLRESLLQAGVFFLLIKFSTLFLPRPRSGAYVDGGP